MLVIGVRSSWLTVEMNSVLARSASTSAVMSRNTDTEPRYSSDMVTGATVTVT